jgi:chromosome segregation ATPase
MPSPDMNNMARIFEDIGALKALVASMDAKLDDGNREFKSLRDDQVELRIQVQQIKVTGEARSEQMNRIETTVKTVEQRVDQLVALRHRVGGAIFLMSLVSGALYEVWGNLTKILDYLGRVAK